MSAESAKAAEKIGKLLSKAERTDNPHEADAFMRKAEALMIQLGISEAMARQAAGGPVQPAEIVERKIPLYVRPEARTWNTRRADTHTCVTCKQELPEKKFPTTKDRYYRGVECRTCRDTRSAGGLKVAGNNYNRTHIEGFFVVCPHLGVRTFRRGDHMFYCVGFEPDADRAVALLRSLQLQAVAAMWRWWKTHPDERRYAWDSRDVFTARRDFLFNFYLGVASRLRETRRDQVDATPGAALALRDKAAELKDHMATSYNIKEGKGIDFGSSDAGRKAGREARLSGNEVSGGRAALTRT